MPVDYHRFRYLRLLSDKLLAAHLYSAMPGKSGTAAAVNSLFGSVWTLVPAMLGFIAQRFGLGPMLWLLLLGPLALLLGIPRQRG